MDKLCRYVGVIKDVPIQADMNNRTYLLDKLDDARVRGVATLTCTKQTTTCIWCKCVLCSGRVCCHGK